MLTAQQDSGEMQLTAEAWDRECTAHSAGAGF